MHQSEQDNDIVRLVDQIIATVNDEATIDQNYVESNESVLVELDTESYESTDTKENDDNVHTMERWLMSDKLIVHPVWIGCLAVNATVNTLRNHVELYIGQDILISTHVTDTSNHIDRKSTYAWVNLPTAEKQLLTVTLLDGKIFMGRKLIARPFKPSRYPQNIFGNNNYISGHFREFIVIMNHILSNSAQSVNLTVKYVRGILDNKYINADYLPNNIWMVQCSLVPQCHRRYCPFYHCDKQKEIGRIISVITASNESKECSKIIGFKHQNNDNTPMYSENILLLKYLPYSSTSESIKETFGMFGEIDCVILHANYPCYVRMKRKIDARKIVHLCKNNDDGITVDFAPSGATQFIWWWFNDRPEWICFGYIKENQGNLSYAFPMPLIKCVVGYFRRLELHVKISEQSQYVEDEHL